MRVKELIQQLQAMSLDGRDEAEVFVVTRSGPHLDPLLISTESTQVYLGGTNWPSPIGSKSNRIVVIDTAALQCFGLPPRET